MLGIGFALASTVRVDNGFQAWFDHDDPAYLAYVDYLDEFGSDEVAYIMYEAPGSEHGPWNIDIMQRVAELTEVLEREVPFVGEATSVANAELLVPVDGGIDVIDLSEDFPATQDELLEVRERFLAKPLYVGGLLSASGDYASIILEMERSSADPAEELMHDPEGGNVLANFYPQASYTVIEEILARPEYAGIVFHHSGDVAMNSVMNTVATEEPYVLGSICMAVVAVLLFFFFRSPIGVVGPMAVVMLSTMACIAVVALFGWELNNMFIMIPTLITAVGVADSVHIISEFRALEAELGDRREALVRTMYLVGPPCLLTSLTTAAGFGAMAIAPIKAIGEFGVYSAIGVLTAFALSTSLLIVFFSFGRRRPVGETSESVRIRAKGGVRMMAFLDAISGFDLRHHHAILVGSAILFVVSVAGTLRLQVDSNFLNDFGSHHPMYKTTRLIDDVMGGMMSIVYVFDTGESEGVKDPEVLRQIESVARVATGDGELVKKSYAITDIVRDINQTFHEGDAAHHVLPETRDLVGQYLLLYEMSGGEEAEEYLSGDFSRANLELRCRVVESSMIAGIADKVAAYRESLPDERATVQLTGVGALWIRLMDYITESQIRGFMLAFVAISVMMCAVFRSVKIGMIAMLPNLAPVFLTLGGMGWAGVTLDYVRMLIAPVAIGIAVDDTIHHVTRFRYEFLQSGSYEKALRASMRDVGRALLITSMVLVLGFLVFTASELEVQRTFGVLLASTIVTALLADFFLMPALMLTLKPFGKEKTDSSPQN